MVEPMSERVGRTALLLRVSLGLGLAMACKGVYRFRYSCFVQGWDLRNDLIAAARFTRASKAGLRLTAHGPSIV